MPANPKHLRLVKPSVKRTVARGRKVNNAYRVREHLKVLQKQPKRGRLWLTDGSCIRLRPEHLGGIASACLTLRSWMLPPEQTIVACSRVLLWNESIARASKVLLSGSQSRAEA